MIHHDVKKLNRPLQKYGRLVLGNSFIGTALCYMVYQFPYGYFFPLMKSEVSP